MQKQPGTLHAAGAIHQDKFMLKAILRHFGIPIVALLLLALYVYDNPSGGNILLAIIFFSVGLLVWWRIAILRRQLRSRND